MKLTFFQRGEKYSIAQFQMFISAACAIKKVESNRKGGGWGVGPNLEGQASLENWHLDWSLEGEWEVSKLKDELQKKGHAQRL